MENEKTYALVEGGVADSDGVLHKAVAIRASVVKYQDGQFLAFKAVQSNKRYVDMTFTREAKLEDLSMKNSLYILVYDDGDLSIDKNRLYPRVYVRKYVALLPYDKEFKHTFTI